MQAQKLTSTRVQAQRRVDSQTANKTSYPLSVSTIDTVTSIVSKIAGFEYVIGETSVLEIGANDSVSPLKVYVAKKKESLNDYFLVDAQGNILGTTTIHLYKKGENKGYGIDYGYQIFPGAVYVENMESLDDNYKGVGTRLHQIAVKIAELAGYGTRVLLDAEKSSHIFHYKFGFRPMSEKYWQDEEKIEREIEIAERKVRKGLIESIKEHDTSHLGPIPMYLPEDRNTISKLKSGSNILYNIDHEIIRTLFS